MGVKKRPVSPRQKMINLMYVVLMAMLALNVSSDVLNGFSLVEDSLNRTTANANKENEGLYRNFDDQLKANPVKVKEWFDKARYVKRMSDSLFYLAEELKIEIVKKADGEKGNLKNIQNKEDLDAAAKVMLESNPQKGEKLYRAILRYRERILAMVKNEDQRSIIKSNLSTSVPRKDIMLGRNWQEYMFENMPVAAATTLLTKLQSDVRYAEGEVLHTLVSNIDVKDVRVNALEAYVIPNSQTIVQGGQFSARIIMAAVDTTMRPQIFIGGRKINTSNGLYSFTCGRTGDFTFNGYIQMPNGSGDLLRRNFAQKYTVVAPSATVSADLMNVLYAGYSNPMSVSIPGVPTNKVLASMTGGSLTAVGAGKFIARPTSVGKDAVITIRTDMNGHIQEMGQFTFRVRKLPDPTAYIAYKDDKGNEIHYVGGGRMFSKSQLLTAPGIGASIDDGLLDINFRVLGFETTFFDNMGNVVPEISTSSEFTQRQKDIFRRLGHGKQFYINKIRAVGPDGIERRLPQSLQVIIN
ncbi:MAG: gliding motility protein GldM [Bacteroidaceae bacterium]